MRLERSGIRLFEDEGQAVLYFPEAHRTTDGWCYFSPEDLRWLCLVAGPALLNELEKEAKDDSGTS